MLFESRWQNIRVGLHIEYLGTLHLKIGAAFTPSIGIWNVILVTRHEIDIALQLLLVLDQVLELNRVLGIHEFSVGSPVGQVCLAV